MRNPWLDLPLDEYEAHMELPTVGQSQLIAHQLDFLIRTYSPSSVAIIGCSGGSGFDCLASTQVKRVVGVDINPQYVAAANRRYFGRVPGLELHVADIQTPMPCFEPVDLIYAALVLEYVDIRQAITSLRAHCNPEGLLSVLLQMPHQTLAEVSPSPYTSLRRLEPAMHLVPKASLHREAARTGFTPEFSKTVLSPAGKEFSLEVFRLERGVQPDGEGH